MPVNDKPKKIFLRAYDVGFGDCFLLTFHYSPQDERHVLIDFGSTELPEKKTKSNKYMKMVAEDIKAKCGGKLQIVVATHRHQDHISGFATDSGPGSIIRDCQPEMVILPWTEDPDAQIDAIQPTALTATGDFKKDPQRMFAATLEAMQEVAESTLTEITHLENRRGFSSGWEREILAQLRFIGEDGLKNKSAVKNLVTMGNERHYVYFEYDKLDLSQILPGVEITVLGPPTLKQTETIKKQRSKDKDEFWMLQAAAKNYWETQAATSRFAREVLEKGEEIFPDAECYEHHEPPTSRWFLRRLKRLRSETLLQIVRSLDKVLNNTSVILLFQVGDKKLLFPGDAQIENWEYALKKEDHKERILTLLSDTTLYKVGHHGSRNATPKTLWKNFDNKSENENDTNRLQAVISTKTENKHGSVDNRSEVPRQTLVTELEKFSKYDTTQILEGTDELSVPIEIKI